jgi:hypothetical protein
VFDGVSPLAEGYLSMYVADFWNLTTETGDKFIDRIIAVEGPISSASHVASCTNPI